MNPRWFVMLGKLGWLVLVAQAGFAGGADLKVLSAPGMRPAISELAPQFERASGHKIVVDYEPSGHVRKRIEAGEAFDVLISTPDLMQDGVRSGKLTEPRTTISRSGMGIAARAGAPKLSIDSADNLKRVLLGAKSIAYSAEGFTGAHFLGVVDRLNLGAQVKPKLKPQENGDLALRAVADGEAELAVAGMTVLIAAPGIRDPRPAAGRGAGLCRLRRGAERRVQGHGRRTGVHPVPHRRTLWRGDESEGLRTARGALTTARIADGISACAVPA